MTSNRHTFFYFFVIEKLKSINQSLIEILNHKKESVETLKREYEISTTYEKREEIHRKYLNALDEVKNTGGEDINAIQDQLQKLFNISRICNLHELQKCSILFPAIIF